MGLVNAEPRWLSELVVWGPVPRIAATKVGVVATWTRSFQGEAGELVSLLELVRRKIGMSINGGIEIKSHCPYFHKVGEYIFALCPHSRSYLIKGIITDRGSQHSHMQNPCWPPPYGVLRCGRWSTASKKQYKDQLVADNSSENVEESKSS